MGAPRSGSCSGRCGATGGGGSEPTWSPAWPCGLFLCRSRSPTPCLPGYPRAVVLDAETTPSIDVTGAQMLADLANNLRGRGTRLLVARDVGQVRDVLRRIEVPDTDA